MTRQLYLMRHGKSAWDTDAATDFERPLAARGRRDAKKMAKWLRKSEALPARVVSSPALRARQTAERLCDVLHLGPDAVAFDERLYEADLSALREVLADCPPETGAVLLVGHNPGLDELLCQLCPGVPWRADGKLLTTAALARLELPDDWRSLGPGCARLLSLDRPKELERQENF